MQDETIEKVEKEIVQKTTIPNKLKERIRREIFLNILLAIAIIVYFIVLILGSIESIKVSRSTDFKIFSLILLFISIVLFEVAYKKSNGKLAINGIEILLVAIVTLFLPYIVFELDETHQKYYILSMSLIAVYYIIKSIIIAKKAKKAYVKKESDIKEITKKEKKNVNILDKEIEISKAKNDKKQNSNKRIEHKHKEHNNERDTYKSVNIKETKPNKNIKNEDSINSNKDVEVKVVLKKRERPKKETTEKESKKKEDKKEIKVKEVEIENTPKKRGRPKKENIEQESRKKKAPQEEQVPKKRGRPRKAVVSK